MTPPTTSALSSGDTHVAASLLDALVQVVEAAGTSAEAGGAARGRRIAELAAQLLPGSRLLASTDDEVVVSLTESNPSETRTMLPPTRVRLVAEALACLASEEDESVRPRLDLRMVDGVLCWVQSIRLANSPLSPTPSPVRGRGGVPFLGYSMM